MRLSIVVPAYNEAKRLPATLDEIVRYLSLNRRWLPAEIVIVDDGSSDGTSAVAAAASDSAEVTVRCLSHHCNRGKGAAVRTGFAAARGDRVLLCDADLATPISELDRLATVGNDAVAIGSRAVDRSRIERRQPLYRDLMGRGFNLLVRLVAAPGIHDTQCGFKLFGGDLAHRLASAQRLDGFAFDVELLLLARSWGHELREIPVRWRHVDESRVRPVAHSVDMFLDLLRIAWWRLTRQLALGDAP
jgi:dolichyl-phosphate beta-glucosyltransferase